jgi:multidrug resistance protein, MATE family
MKFRRHIRESLGLAIPVAASQVSDMLVLTADAIMVGVLGPSQLAGVSLASSVSFIVMLFAVGFVAAITPLAGEAHGRGNLTDVVRYGRAGLMVSVAVTLVLMAILIPSAPYLSLLGAPSDTTEHAVPFFRWIVASFLFRMLFGAFKQTAEAMANTRVAMVLNIATNVVNVGFNWVFIYGNLGMPELGAEGSGVATFLARVVCALAAWLIFRRFGFFAPVRAEWQRQRRHAVAMADAVRRIIKDGTGIGLQIVVEVFGFATGTIMMGWISTTAIAAHQVALNPASISFMIAMGLASAATIRISNFRGEHHADLARQAARAAFVMVLGYEVVIAVIFVVFRWLIPTFYITDPAVLELASTLLIYAAAFSLFDGAQCVGLGVLRGYNDIKIPTMIATISYLVIQIPIGYVAAFVFGMGAQGIWVGYCVGLVVASVAYFVRFRRITRADAS